MLTAGTDTVFYSSGTNTVNEINLTLNSTDKITGGTGTDTLSITSNTLGPFTFGNGAERISLTNFEVLDLNNSNNGNHIDSVTFKSSFENNGTLSVDGSGIGGNGKLNLDASEVTTGAFNVIGGNDNDIIKGGSGADTISGGNGADAITGNGGADALNGGAGNDIFKYNGSANSSNSAFDTITGFVSGADKIQFNAGNGVTAAAAALSTATSSVAAGRAAWFVDSANNQVIVYANPTGTALNGGSAGLIEIHLSGSTSFAADLHWRRLAPAGVAGEPINLGLIGPSESGMSIAIEGLPAGWFLSEGALSVDGTWTVQPDDISALTITSPNTYTGAMALRVTVTYADGSSGCFHFDNVEVLCTRLADLRAGRATTT